MSDIDTVKQKYEMLRAAMDKRMSRLWAASEAIALGWGGVTLVAEATGISQAKICAGMRELEQSGLIPTTPATPQPPEPRPSRVQWRDRIRRPGGGRKLTEIKDPAIVPTLEKLLTNEVGGDPTSDRRWVRCSLRQLCANRQRIVQSGGSFFRHRITSTNVGQNRHMRRRMVEVLAGTTRWKHRRGVEPDLACRAAQRVFPSQFARFSAYPLAPTRGRSQRSNESKRAPKRRQQRSPPPPISTMRCRSGATKAARCVVGKSSTMRCRSAAM